MRHMIKTLSVALAAVFVFGAVAAASASASQPKAEPEGGTFPVKFTGSNTAGGTLETVGGRKVHCTSDTSVGSVNSETTVTGAKVLFKGCNAEVAGIKLPCKSSGKGAEEVETVALKGKLVYIKLANGEEKVGIDLEPETGTAFATFVCGPTLGVTETLTVRGSVVGELSPIGTLTKSFTLSFAQTSGKQNPEGYLNPVGCGFVKDVLETEGKGEGFGSQTWAFEQSGVSTTESLTTEKGIKVVGEKCV